MSKCIICQARKCKCGLSDYNRLEGSVYLEDTKINVNLKSIGISTKEASDRMIKVFDTVYKNRSVTVGDVKKVIQGRALK